MKVVMGGSVAMRVLVCITVIALFSPMLLASDDASDSFATTWIGFVEGKTGFYRIELAPDGSGVAARSSLLGGEDMVQVFRVENWALKGSKFEAEMIPIEPASRVSVRGRLEGPELRLSIRRGNLPPLKLRLRRADESDATRRRVERALEEVKRDD